jgi:LysM repeat protein
MPKSVGVMVNSVFPERSLKMRCANNPMIIESGPRLSINHGFPPQYFTNRDDCPLEPWVNLVGGDVHRQTRRIPLRSSVAQLQRLNKLETPAVRVGQVIVVPDSATAKPSAPISHQVQAGETLYAIARKYAVNLETLQQLNKLESPVVKVGQVLLIPSVLKPVASNPEVKPVVTVKPTVSSKPAETKQLETKLVSGNPKPVKSKPVKPKPVETKPVSSEPAEAKPVVSKPVESKPVVLTKPAEPKSVEVKPVSSTPKPTQTPTVSPKPAQPAPKPDLKPVPLGGSSASGKPVRAVSVGKFVLDPGSSRVLPTMPVPVITPSSSSENVNTSPWPNLEGAPGQSTQSEPDAMTPAVPTPEVRPAAPSSSPAGATRIQTSGRSRIQTRARMASHQRTAPTLKVRAWFRQRVQSWRLTRFNTRWFTVIRSTESRSSTA